MKSINHPHTLRRVKGRKFNPDQDLYMCADPLCSFKQSRSFLVGKEFQCPYCGNHYIADYAILTLAIPHCPSCTKGKKQRPDTSSLTGLVLEQTSLDKMEQTAKRLREHLKEKDEPVIIITGE